MCENELFAAAVFYSIRYIPIFVWFVTVVSTPSKNLNLNYYIQIATLELFRP